MEPSSKKDQNDRYVVATQAMQDHPKALWASRSAAAFVGGAMAVGWGALLFEPALGLATAAGVSAGVGALAGFLTHWCIEKINPEGVAATVSRFSNDRAFAAEQEARVVQKERARAKADPGRGARLFETVSFAALGAMASGNLWGVLGGAAVGYTLALMREKEPAAQRPAPAVAAKADSRDPAPH